MEHGDIDVFRLAHVAVETRSPELLDQVLSQDTLKRVDLLKCSNLAGRAALMGNTRSSDVLHQAIVDQFVTSSSTSTATVEFRVTDMEAAPTVLFAALQHFMDRWKHPDNRTAELRWLIDVSGHTLHVLSKSVPADDFDPEARALVGEFLARFDESPTDGLALCEAAIKQFKDQGPGTRQDRELFGSTTTPLASRSGSLANIYLSASVVAELSGRPQDASRYRSLARVENDRSSQEWSDFLDGH